MSSFLYSFSSSRELAFDSADAQEDMNSSSALDAELNSSNEPDSTIASATGRLRSALNSMRNTGENAMESNKKKSTFSSFFKR